MHPLEDTAFKLFVDRSEKSARKFSVNQRFNKPWHSLDKLK